METAVVEQTLEQATEKITEPSKPSGRLTFEDFLAWADEDIYAELEDGELVYMSPASRTHQRLFRWLLTILTQYVLSRRCGEVIPAPFAVRLHKSGQVREPDLVFVRNKNLKRIKNTHVDGAPDLVVEIVSPESIDRDRGRKFVEYEAEAIPEYWLIDPIRRQAEFYRLGEDRHYHQALPDGDGIFHSEAVPGFRLRVAWMWEEPLPIELDILREMGLLD